VEAAMISKIIIVAWSLFCAVNFFTGIHNLSVNHLDNNFALVFALLFNLVLWGLIVVPTAVIGMLFKRKTA
jgi:hypothetical protein